MLTTHKPVVCWPIQGLTISAGCSWMTFSPAGGQTVRWRGAETLAVFSELLREPPADWLETEGGLRWRIDHGLVHLKTAGPDETEISDHTRRDLRDWLQMCQRGAHMPIIGDSSGRMTLWGSQRRGRGGITMQRDGETARRLLWAAGQSGLVTVRIDDVETLFTSTSSGEILVKHPGATIVIQRTKLVSFALSML